MKKSDMLVEFSNAVDDMVNFSREDYGSHSYAAGVLRSVVYRMFQALGKKDQEFFLSEMQHLAAKFNEEIPVKEFNYD